jgi:FkbM family methyltransferase
MNINDLKKQIDKINLLKSKNNYNSHSLNDLQNLPTFNGLSELSFRKNFFYMLNIANDDAVPLKYLWRNSYENLSLNLWYDLTRQDGFFFDVGAHTGIFSIIGNLNKTYNNIISIEPYFLNFARLLSNLKINNFSQKSCLMAAASNEKGSTAFAVGNEQTYHSSSGSISDVGNHNVPKIKIDNFNFDKKIYAIKIDTEGHEFDVLQGGINSIKKDKPDIIFEINENAFNNCLDLLTSSGYEYFYFINEVDQSFIPIKEFSSSLIKLEGSNCYATTNTRFI